MALFIFIAVLTIQFSFRATAAPNEITCSGGHKENERWDDGKSVYTCKREGEYYIIEPIGCVGDASKRMELGEKVISDDLVYECRLNRNFDPFLAPWGCAGKDGRQHATGDQYDFGDFWYYCMDNDGDIKAKPVGCVHEGTRLKDGERFFKDDVIFQCYIRQTEADVRAVGCVTQNVANGAKIERRVGCSWQEGQEPFQYTLTCKQDEGNKKSATKTAVRCNYVLPNGVGTYNIELGCYRAIDKTGVACMKGASAAEVKFISLPVDENGNVKSPPAGLRLC